MSQDQASAAADCFKELAPHVFVGGKSGVLNSGSGAHLASGVLRSDPSKVGRINQQLVMSASVTVSFFILRTSQHGLIRGIGRHQNTVARQRSYRAHPVRSYGSDCTSSCASKGYYSTEGRD
jgi:hypothetical protein